MNGKKIQEEQVVALIQEGKANKEIALELGKSEQRVKDIIHKLLRKHKCKNRTELAMKFAGVS